MMADPQGSDSFYPRGHKMNGDTNGYVPGFNYTPDFYGDEMAVDVEEQKKPVPTEEIFVKVMKMQGPDKRFGFSVIGGTDEGFEPKIEEIMSGKSMMFLV
ncbi:unnamed protein product, partial [Owenia fusiformis]